MAISINLTADQTAGLAYGTAQRNAANPSAEPMTTTQFATDILAVQCEAFARQKEEADLSALADDDSLMAVGLKALAASPQKKAAMIAAAEAALASPPSRP